MPGFLLQPESGFAPVSRIALLGWCAAFVAFLFYAALDTDGFLLLDNANLMIHEAGHVLFGWAGYYTQILGGTLAQVARLFVTLLNTSGQIQAETLEDDTITAAKIATDAIAADGLAADAVTEIWAKTITAPTAAPSSTATALQSVAWLLTLARNKITQTSTTQTLRNDADDTTIATAAVAMPPRPW